jgi:RND family efflux transporter MFP subunit
MGTITDVLVHEGDVVRSGQPVLHIDARDLTAKSAQVAASIADAEAMQRDAGVQAKRIRALFADSAATRAQLDAVETAVARADAGVRAARASSNELDAMQSYATVRAPFDGVITRRLVDPGAFAAPGAPLITVQDVSSLRITATVAADGVHGMRRGQTISVSIDTLTVNAVIEGVVPAGAGNLFTVNATLANSRNALRAGSAAVMHVPTAAHRALLVPMASLVREGDLTGVVLRGAVRDERRWIRIGSTNGAWAEVTSGLASGDVVIVPPAASSTTPAVPRSTAPVSAPSRPSSR